MINTFTMNEEPLEDLDFKSALITDEAGAYVIFEGWVRNLNEGKDVSHLEYHSYAELANKEGQKIIDEALEKFNVIHVSCKHRIGELKIREMAVFVGVTSVHRGDAYEASRYIIDEVKSRVPIWKKEFYQDGDSGWVECHECANAAQHHH